MTSILGKIVVNAVAIWVAAFIVPAVTLKGDSTGGTILSYLVVGAIFGLVNTFIKPVITFFAFPFILLTLGLLSLVVNAFMLKIVDWAASALGIGFNSGPFFWSTIAAALIITLVSMVLNTLVPDGD